MMTRRWCLKDFKRASTSSSINPSSKTGCCNLVRVTNSVNRVEKRFHRVQVRQKVKVTFNLESVERKTIDLSLNGVLVRTPKTFAPESHVRIQLDLSEEKIRLSAAIWNCRRARMGFDGHPFPKCGDGRKQAPSDFLLPLMIKSDTTANE